MYKSAGEGKPTLGHSEPARSGLFADFTFAGCTTVRPYDDGRVHTHGRHHVNKLAVLSDNVVLTSLCTFAYVSVSVLRSDGCIHCVGVGHFVVGVHC